MTSPNCWRQHQHPLVVTSLLPNLRWTYSVYGWIEKSLTSADWLCHESSIIQCKKVCLYTTYFTPKPSKAGKPGMLQWSKSGSKYFRVQHYLICMWTYLIPPKHTHNTCTRLVTTPSTAVTKLPTILFPQQFVQFINQYIHISIGITTP